MKTEALKQALDKYGFDAAFGGARRDEEKAAPRSASSRSARRSTLGSEEPAPRALAPLQHAQEQGREHPVFPLSNWTELDVWQYIRLENIPIVPLYFAGAGPVVERDGTLIMVDDERMPLKPGESRDENGALPHAGLLSADRRDRSDADDAARDHQEMLLTTTSERQGRLIDHDERRLDGEEEARGVFLMARISDLIATDIAAPISPRAHQEPAALHHLRLGRRRQSRR
jgi:sulfate adenylyltransferase subunit 2